MDRYAQFKGLMKMKQKIVRIIAILCYYLGIDAFFYWLNKDAKRIVTFHNVMPESILPQGKRIGLTDTEETFRQKVRLMKSRFKIGNDLSDARQLTITFDDGYLNQSEVAGRILKEEGDLPAIIFAAGRMIDNAEPSEALVVDLLLHWIQLAPNGTYKLAGDYAVEEDFELNASNRMQMWSRVIWPSFCRDYDAEGRHLLAELDSQYPINEILSACSDEYLRLRMTGITSEDIEALTFKGWQIGWHTQEHYPLSKLSTAEKQKEIMDAPEGMKSVVFSYPYGELDSVDKESIMIVESAGYPCAVSNVSEHNALMSKYFIPRMMLDGNFYQCHMELSGLKYFLKTRKLLPKI